MKDMAQLSVDWALEGRKDLISPAIQVRYLLMITEHACCRIGSLNFGSDDQLIGESICSMIPRD
jgi:hypothetical protein